MSKQEVHIIYDSSEQLAHSLEQGEHDIARLNRSSEADTGTRGRDCLHAVSEGDEVRSYQEFWALRKPDADG